MQNESIGPSFVELSRCVLTVKFSLPPIGNLGSTPSVCSERFCRMPVVIKKHKSPLARRHLTGGEFQLLELDLGSDIQSAWKVAKLLEELNGIRVCFSFNGFQVDTESFKDEEELMRAYRTVPGSIGV